MKRAAVFAILAMLYSAASASWDSLDSINMSSELDPVNDENIPRLLAEVLGDAAIPGSYATSATPAAAAVEKPTSGPAVYEVPATTTPAPVTSVMQPTQQTVVEAPTAPAAAAETPATTPGTVTIVTSATAPATEPSLCPADTVRADYTAGTLFCVLAAEGDAQGEVYIATDKRKALASGNNCFSAPCGTGSSATATYNTGRKMLRWLMGTESAQAQQRAEFLPFLLAIAHATQQAEANTSTKPLAHSKCFYVCEPSSRSSVAVLGN